MAAVVASCRRCRPLPEARKELLCGGGFVHGQARKLIWSDGMVVVMTEFDGLRKHLGLWSGFHGLMYC